MLFPKVSVAIITYNQQDFIEETLLSALEQEYDNLEVVVADDHSTDATPAIIRSLAAKYPGRLVPALGEQQGGITRNTNRALKYCAGEYVAFQGGDDVLLPGKIKKQVEFMQARPDVTLSYHDVDVFDTNTNQTLYLWSQRYGKRHGGVETVIRYGTYMCGTAVMVRKSALPTDGADERIRVASDWYLWVQSLMQSGGRVGYIDNVLARYRRSLGNVTRQWGWKFEDQNMTLALIESRWPQYLELARRRRSEVRFMHAVREYKTGNRLTAFKLVWDASVSCFPNIPWLRLVARELMFAMQVRGKHDDMVKSLFVAN